MAFLGKLKKNGAPSNKVPSLASNAVLKPSDPVAPSMREVDGIDFEDYAGRDITVSELVAGMTNMGFQASAVTEATRIINDMVPAPSRQADDQRLICGDRERGAIQRRARRPRYSWVTLQTWSRQACEKHYGTLSSTNMYQQS